MITIRAISPRQTYPLRHAVLWPDKPIAYVKIDDDDDGYHYGAFRAGELVAVISLFVAETAGPQTAGSGGVTARQARFRKFATRPDCQRTGIGTQLLNHVMAQARHLNATTLWCDARLESADFYRRFGMEPVSAVFYKETIAYARFSLTLSCAGC